MFKWIARALLAFGLILVLVIAAGLGYRAWRQHEAEGALAIASPAGIDEAMFVPINGSEQWITIRGQDRSNPVVLLIHGGPGTAVSPFPAFTLAYEKNYTVVQWDQPGAGKTFGRAGRKIPGDLSLEDIVADGNAVAEFLESHLETGKIILLGSSWGSIVGIEMARARPDLFAAYVGTGQIINLQRGEAIAYQRVLDLARAQKNEKAIKELEAIGPPPYQGQRELGTQRKWASRLIGERIPAALLLENLWFAPHYSLGDIWSYLEGSIASQNHFVGPNMQGPMMTLDLAAEGLEFRLPIFVIQGTKDYVTPVEPVRAYVEAIAAPQKAFIPIEGAGHLALVNNAAEFLKVLNERVRPLAVASSELNR